MPVPHSADHSGAAPAGQLGGQRTHAAEHAVYQQRPARHRTVGKHGAVGGDAGDAEAGTGFVADTSRGSGDGLVLGDDRVLGGRAERAV